MERAMNLGMIREVRGDFGELAAEETLLQQPLVDEDLQAHPVFDGEGGKEVDHVAPVGLDFSHTAEFIA